MFKKTLLYFVYALFVFFIMFFVVSSVYKNKYNPLISVIITSYNYEKYIPKTIESVLNQSYKNFEIIIVDDGSKDLSRDIIKIYSDKHKNIKFYTHKDNKNMGFIETMKLAISKASGDYIAFCESDDFWVKDNIKEKIEIIKKHKDAVIISNSIFVFGDHLGVVERQRYINFVDKTLSEGKNLIDINKNKNVCYIPTLSAVMIKTDILKKLDFNSPVSAFLDFWLYRQILSEYPLYYTKRKLTFWRQHNSFNGLLNSKNNIKKMDLFINKSDILLNNKKI